MIVLQGVTKRFGSLTAVDNLTCRIPRGDYFALLGPNGAGKTTVVRMLMGLVQPTAGRLTIDGIPVSDPAARRRVGYLPEDHRIPPHLSGRAYLKRHASLMGMERAEADADIDRLLALVSMDGRDRQKAAGYSKGMQQRIGLAAALLGGPALLVLDEPVTGLDPVGIRDVRGILDRQRDRGLTVLLNSHLLSEVEKTCQTVAIMNNGKICVTDSLRAILDGDRSLEDVFMRYIRS